MSVELRKAIRMLIALSAAGALSQVAPAVAQEEEEPEAGDDTSVAVTTDGGIEEIIVTARQKRAATDIIRSGWTSRSSWTWSAWSRSRASATARWPPRCGDCPA